MLIGARIQYDHVSFIEEGRSVPQTNPGVLRNYPNPSKNLVTIVYDIPERSNVAIRIYNEAGQKVRTLIDSQQDARKHVIIWDGRDDRGAIVPSGMYFYQLRAGTYASSSKLILIK